MFKGALYAENKADRPIFIGGLMKSGTSLMRVLLAQHPSLFGSFETHWFTDPMRIGWRDTSTRRIQYLLDFFELESKDYRALCAQKEGTPNREFIDIVMEYCAARAGKQRWVEKTPDNIRHWSLIRAEWPNAYLVHVTREYKDCYASWKGKRGDGIEAFIKSASTAYDDLGSLLGNSAGCYIEVDYNDLVRNTEATMRSLLNALQLEWSDSCTCVDTDATAVERGKVKNVLGRESHTAISLTRPIFTDSIGQWKRILDDDEVLQIEQSLATWYQVFGKRWESV